VGEGAVIAQRTGVVTVSDFRVRDLAAGGQGAPLVPYADYLLFHQPGETVAVQNLGGIANVTLVPDRLDEVIAFDTGPGNALMDEAVRMLTDGREAMDRDGERAARGRVDVALLDAFLAHPYFVLPPPKSTGRETFGRALVESIDFDRPKIRGDDIVATLAALTVRTIAQAYERFLLPRVRQLGRVILTGGGCRNPVLVEGIRQALRPIPVVRIDDLGIPHQAKEALSFAILANETVAGRPGNVPSATGAKEAVVLGKITL
jgi:anhydro-N-acetylmuramic acid kinase